MTFWITIIKRPRTKQVRSDAIEEGFVDLPELGVMVGEHAGIEGIGGFVWDPDWMCEECPGFDGALTNAISGDARKLLILTVGSALPEAIND